MRIHQFPVSPLMANCYLVSGDGDHAVVVDPGIQAFPAARQVVAETGLTPVAVLLTHGHVDHAGDAHLVAAEYDVPVHCHSADHPMLTEPALGLGSAFTALLRQWGVDVLPAPSQLHEHPEAQSVAGLTIRAVHLPGHTPGSVVLGVSDAAEEVWFTGDVLFAGSIGRTDLPGGSMAQMTESLGRLASTVPAGATVLPGHGPSTTMAGELATNPYLARLGG